ncbi:unnamed protein product [Merluccius merluccius]
MAVSGATQRFTHFLLNARRRWPRPELPVPASQVPILFREPYILSRLGAGTLFLRLGAGVAGGRARWAAAAGRISPAPPLLAWLSCARLLLRQVPLPASVPCGPAGSAP